MMRLRSTIALGVLIPIALTGCELGLKDSQQTGYRGTAGAQITDEDNALVAAAIPDLGFAPPPNTGQLASEAYENVQVLGNLDVSQFNYLMSAMSLWVGGDAANCGYCHNTANMASDEVYTKDVARRMLQMNGNINVNWSDHVRETGVTCYTCHGGNGVPLNVWTNSAPASGSIVNNQRGQNTPSPAVGFASLPNNVFGDYLSGDTNQVRVQSETALASQNSNPNTTRDAEDTYAIMMHLSQALNVNCTYCHNTGSFQSWNMSSPARSTAWYGIRMVRNLNQEYISPLASIFPENRLGPQGDPYKVNCTTCHQGQALPLGGVSMLGDYPYLRQSYEGEALMPAAPAEDVEGEDGAAEEVVAVAN